MHKLTVHKALDLWNFTSNKWAKYKTGKFSILPLFLHESNKLEGVLPTKFVVQIKAIHLTTCYSSKSRKVVLIWSMSASYSRPLNLGSLLAAVCQQSEKKWFLNYSATFRTWNTWWLGLQFSQKKKLASVLYL